MIRSNTSVHRPNDSIEQHRIQSAGSQQREWTRIPAVHIPAPASGWIRYWPIYLHRQNSPGRFAEISVTIAEKGIRKLVREGKSEKIGTFRDALYRKRIKYTNHSKIQADEKDFRPPVCFIRLTFYSSFVFMLTFTVRSPGCLPALLFLHHRL